MMTSLLPARLLVRLIALAPLTGCSLTGASGPPGNLQQFESRLEAIRRDRRIPGMSAAIAKGQQVSWTKGFGFADIAQKVPATDTTAYHIASLTKTFASTVIMQLVETGKLDLDAPVADFGIVLASPGTIRVRHLLTHTSEGDPGSVYQYNGDRFALLGQVIARASGETFGALVVRQIIARLQLPHTAPNIRVSAAFHLTGLDSTQFQKNLAQGYSSDDKTPIPYPVLFGPAAGLISSVVDVAAYSMAIDRNDFLSPATQARIFTAAVSTKGDLLPYGLGWFVQDVRGVRVQWHYGYWTGNSSLIIRVPERGLVFVLLANSDGLSSNTSLGAGNLLSSPAARLFLETFVFGSAVLP